MTTTARLAAFVLLLAAAFGAGAALGNAVGPIDVGDDAPAVEAEDDGGNH